VAGRTVQTDSWIGGGGGGLGVARDPLLTVAMLRRTPMHRKHKCNTADVIFRLEIEKRELRRICRRAGPVLFVYPPSYL
jgi:hypothetical protein